MINIINKNFKINNNNNYYFFKLLHRFHNFYYIQITKSGEIYIIYISKQNIY